MKNLFVSFNYVSRYGTVYDKGFSNFILENRNAPKDQEELEYLTDEVKDMYVEYNRLDNAIITILFFNEI